MTALITKMIVKFLTGRLLKKIIKEVVLDVLDHFARDTETDVDDIMVDGIRRALK